MLYDAKEEKTCQPCESQISLSVSTAVANPDLKVRSCETETAWPINAMRTALYARRGELWDPSPAVNLPASILAHAQLNAVVCILHHAHSWFPADSYWKNRKIVFLFSSSFGVWRRTVSQTEASATDNQWKHFGSTRGMLCGNRS